ncbi:MAG: TlpA disulfide reductase family protein [Acidobacteriota bacterium]
MTLPALQANAPRAELPGIDGRRRQLVPDRALGHTLLAFFKVSCPTCQLAFPFLGRFHARFAAPELRVIAVSQDHAGPTKDFVRRYDVGFPVLLDENDYAASRAYGVVAVPSVVLVDTEGRVARTTQGFVKKDLEELAAELGRLGGRDGSPVWHPGEAVPELKPG